MPINANIALGVTPVELPDFASLAVKRAGMMNAMSQMATRQRALNEQNALAGLVQTPGYDPTNPEWRQKTAFAAPNLGAVFLKAQDDAAAAASAREKAMREETQAKQLTAFGRLLSFKSPEEARADAEAHFKDYEPGVGKSIIEGIPTDPAEFDKWRVSHMQRILAMTAPDKALETEDRVLDAGNRLIPQSRLKYGGQFPQDVITKGMTPDQAADNARQAKADDAAAGRAIVTTDNEGNVTTIAPDGSRIIKQFPAIGKPSSAVEKAAGDRQTEVKAVDSATAVVDELLKPGSLVDKAGGGGIDTASNAVARLAGQTTEKMTAQAALNPLADVLLKQVPRFEGPQSDKDTASYMAAAGKLQDPMATAGEKRAALGSIKELLARRKEWLASNKPAAGSVARDSGGIEDGGEYVRGPDGKLRRK